MDNGGQSAKHTELNSLYGDRLHVLGSSAIDVSLSILHSSECIVLPVLLRSPPHRHDAYSPVLTLSGYLSRSFFEFLWLLNQHCVFLQCVFFYLFADTVFPLRFQDQIQVNHSALLTKQTNQIIH